MFKTIRRLIKILIVFSLFAIGAYIFFFSSNDYHISSYDYVNPSVGSSLNGFKIAYLSDLNINSKNIDKLEKMIQTLNNYPYDMVIFGGDLFDQDIIENVKVTQLLKNIESQYGKFAIEGEKDSIHSLEIKKILNKGGFEVLSDESRSIYYKGGSFTLMAYNQETNKNSLKKDKKTINIGIAHQPDTFSVFQDIVQLQLSGHSLGGSLYIPYLGSLIKNEGAKTYNHGLYTTKSSTLLVSNGVAPSSSFPYKFLSRNEINIITLKTTSD